MATMDAETRNALRLKQRLGLTEPQQCPKCGGDLSDPDVPAEYAEYAPLFTLALARETTAGDPMWQCPLCGHVWRRAT